jgi:cytochrome c553
VASVTIETHRQALYGALCALALAAVTSAAYATGGESPRSITYPPTPNAPAQQTEAAARSKTEGCLTCHEATDQISMHENPGVILGGLPWRRHLRA